MLITPVLCIWPMQYSCQRRLDRRKLGRQTFWIVNRCKNMVSGSVVTMIFVRKYACSWEYGVLFSIQYFSHSARKICRQYETRLSAQAHLLTNCTWGPDSRWAIARPIVCAGKSQMWKADYAHHFWLCLCGHIHGPNWNVSFQNTSTFNTIRNTE